MTLLGMSSRGPTPALQAEGPGFESPSLHHRPNALNPRCGFGAFLRLCAMLREVDCIMRPFGVDNPGSYQLFASDFGARGHRFVQ